MAQVHVRIPTPLRRFTEQRSVVEVQGSTAGQALDALMQRYPALRERVLDEDGQPRRFVNIFANDEDIRALAQLETALNDGDELSIVPAIAGGAS